MKLTNRPDRYDSNRLAEWLGTQHLPDPDRRFESFERNRPLISTLELTPDQTLRHRINDQLIRRRQSLEARGQIRSFTEHRPFRSGVLSDEFAHNDETGRDPDSRRYFKFLIRVLLARKSLHQLQHGQSGMHRTLRVVLMSMGISKIHQKSITHVFCDIAVESADRLTTGIEKTPDRGLEVLGVQPASQRRRAHKITKHDGQLATLRLILAGREGRCFQASCDGYRLKTIAVGLW